jgi:hypothetical protein
VASHVAGIVDTRGGLRVVVTERKSDFNRHHRQPGEMVFVVPGLMVTEPVPWDFIPEMIGRVERHIAEWVRTRNDPDNIKACVAEYLKRVAAQ